MQNYFSFAAGGVSLSGHARIDYSVNGEKRTFIPDFDSRMSATDGFIRVAASPFIPKGGSSVDLQLTVANVSGSDLYLSQVYPAVIDGGDLTVGSCPQSDLVVFNQGRHKNDLPSVCTLGKRDVCWDDMLASLTEGGAVIPPVKKPGTTDVIGDSLTVIYAPDACLTIGYMTTKSQLVESCMKVTDSGEIDSLSLGCIFNCMMKPKEKRDTEMITLSADPDPLRAIDNFAKMKALLYCARVKRYDRRPNVWCSWYYYGSDLKPADITENLAKIDEYGLPFDAFQLDDGWQMCHGDWRAKPIYAERGMKNISDEIKSHGLRPGIWTAPFIADERAAVITEHPEWLLKQKNGEYAKFAKRFYVIDVTRPDVLDYFRELYRQLTFDWGFTYHKLDFSRAFVQVADPDPYDPYVTPVEAYVTAVQAIREGMGDDAYFLMCGGLYDPLIGLVDAQRSGADVTSMWIEPGFDYPTLPYTVKQNTLRYYMNKWWHNDPDALMVRRRSEGGSLKLGLLNDEEAKTFTVNQYFGGGIVCSTENLSEIDFDRLMLLRHVMPAVDAVPTPRRLTKSERFQSQIDMKVTSKWGDEWHTVVFVNWDEEPMPLKVKLDGELCGGYIDGESEYAVSTFYSGELTLHAKAGDELTLGTVAPHGSEVVRIGKMGLPQVVLSNAHYSFGGELDLVTDGGVRGTNPYTVDAEYTVLCADGSLKAAKLSGAER